MKPRCILHIGSAKTGTTALQATLYGNRQSLIERGLLYPSLEKSHIFAVSAFSTRPESLYYNKSAGRDEAFLIDDHNAKMMGRLNAEISSSDFDAMVLSAEHFTLLDEAGVVALRDWLSQRFESTTVYMYARAPQFQVTSRVQQAVKLGRSNLEGLRNSPPVTFYKAVLERWSQAFGRENIVLRAFPGDPPCRGDVVEDFLRCLGLWYEDSPIKTVRSNESLSAPAVAIADMLYEIVPRENRSQKLQSSLYRIKGPKFSIDPEFMENAMRKSEPEMEYLAEKWGVSFDDVPMPAASESAPYDNRTARSLAELLVELTAESGGGDTGGSRAKQIA